MEGVRSVLVRVAVDQHAASQSAYVVFFFKDQDFISKLAQRRAAARPAQPAPRITIGSALASGLDSDCALSLTVRSGILSERLDGGYHAVYIA